MAEDIKPMTKFNDLDPFDKVAILKSEVIRLSKLITTYKSGEAISKLNVEIGVLNSELSESEFKLNSLNTKYDKLQTKRREVKLSNKEITQLKRDVKRLTKKTSLQEYEIMALKNELKKYKGDGDY